MSRKYYPHSDFLNASLGLNGSFSWRGIWGSKSLVKEGLIWRVGDGSRIKAFSDPWVADECAYMLGKSCNLDAFHKVWIDIWSLDTIPKVKQFMWRLCTGSLPTRELLYRRHMIDSSCCPWCADCTESASHALLYCPAALDLWRECDCQELIAGDLTTDFKEKITIWEKVSPRKRLVGVTLMWFLWSRRNDKIFNNKEVPHTVVRDRVMRLVEDCGKDVAKIYGQAKVRTKKSPKPPGDFVKVNCDACLKDEGWVSLGVVIRNSAGKVLHAGTRRT